MIEHTKGVCNIKSFPRTKDCELDDFRLNFLLERLAQIGMSYFLN